MSEVHELRGEVAALSQSNERLLRRVADADQALAAFARGEVDAVTIDSGAPGQSTPILLHAAQASLRSSEQLLRAVFDGALEPMMLTDQEGRFVDANPAACELYGLPLEALRGRALSELTELDDDEALREALREQGYVRRQIAIQRPDGRRRLEYSAVSNVVPGLDLSVMRDITAQIAAEDALRRSEALLRTSRDQLEEAQAIARVGSWTSGLEMTAEIHWTRECGRIFGVPEGTTITVGDLFARVHHADREPLGRANRRAIEQGVPIDIEHRIERPDGTWRWVHARASVRRANGGQPDQMVGTVQDISDRRAAVDALRASEERYRRIVESTTDGIWIYDPNLITTFMNARMANMLGYTVEETVGRHIFTFMDEATHAVARERVARRRQGIAERGELVYRRKDGTPLWTSYQATPLNDAQGSLEGVLVVVTDASSQRRADEALARLAAIVESADDAIYSLDLEGNITSWNSGAARLYGYAASEVLGQGRWAPIPVDHRDETAALLKRVESDGSFGRLETVRRRKDGTQIDVAITISAIQDAHGKIVGTSVITRDLTERRVAEAALRSTEEQFRQAQKMEAVGRLAGGVAHDFNNLLSVILSYAELTLGDLRKDDPLRTDIAEIHSAGQRAAALTQQLLAFSRQQVLQPRVIDLNAIIEGMKSMLARLLGEDVELTTSTAGEIGRVRADAGQIEQVVMNLAVNARDAMPHGGKLTIETANVELDGEQVKEHYGVTPGSYVLLAVSDTGAGMDAATRARIFEPFFTTKEKGKGTGLGLSTVFGIVQQSGGHVSIHSEPGRGSTFKVYLRRTDRAAEERPTAQAKVLRGTETILLVEDEDQVRAVACAILRRNGYHVIETANGGEASLVAKDLAATIHLLLTDVVMPRMSGRKLAEELTRSRPEMKVLFASGYTDDAIVHHGVLDAGVAFLQKPFTPDALLRKVREVLEAPG